MRNKKEEKVCRYTLNVQREFNESENSIENSDTTLSSLSLMSLYNDNSDNNDTNNDKCFFGLQVPENKEKQFFFYNDTVFSSVTFLGDCLEY